MPEIVETVCEVFGDVTPAEIMSDQRPDRIAFPRQVAMAIKLEASPLMSQGQVAKRFNRDRGTVIHAIKAVKNRCENEPPLREKVNRLRMTFNLPPL